MEKATVKLNTKSWHYRFMKFVLGSIAPTPQNMHNLCPYFWLLIFSILVSPIVLPIKVFFNFFMWIIRGWENFLNKFMISPAAKTWEEKLTELDVYQIFYANKQIKKFYRILHGDDDNYINRDDFVYNWFKKTYNKEVFQKAKSGDKNWKTYTKDFQDWLEKCRNIELEILKERKKKQAEKKEIYEQKMSKVRDNLDNWFNKVRSNMRSWNNIIKWTKRIVGVLVTLALLTVTYFIVNFMGKGVLWLVEHWDWRIFLVILFIAVAAVVVISIFKLLGAWLGLIAEKGTKLWYVNIIYWFGLVIYWPLKIVLYYFIWQLILVNLWYVIKKGAQLIWGSLLGFLGIFGEYFGASYTDYCPGIEWEESK